jgi:hypothetical protein
LTVVVVIPHRGAHAHHARQSETHIGLLAEGPIAIVAVDVATDGAVDTVGDDEKVRVGVVIEVDEVGYPRVLQGANTGPERYIGEGSSALYDVVAK